MKILYIYKYAILGGVTTQLVNRHNFLMKHAEMHYLFINDYGGTKAFYNNTNIIIEKNIKKISAYIDKHSFDYIITIDTMEVFDALKKAKTHPKVIYEVHTTTSNLNNLKQLKGNSIINAFITPSEYLKNRIEKEYGFYGLKPCYVVENCLDTSRFNIHYNTKRHDNKIIAWIGKLDEHKNWRKFLLVASQILMLHQDVEFWVIGGYTAPQYTVKEFVDKINEYDMFDKVKWFSYLEYSKMPILYNKVVKSGGVVVSTSHNESFGMTAVEAMACKCPILMPKVGAIPEVLDGPLKNNLYEYDRNDLLIEKTINILRNREINTKLEYGFNKVQKKYDINSVGKKYLQILSKI